MSRPALVCLVLVPFLFPSPSPAEEPWEDALTVRDFDCGDLSGEDRQFLSDSFSGYAEGLDSDSYEERQQATATLRSALDNMDPGAAAELGVWIKCIAPDGASLEAARRLELVLKDFIDDSVADRWGAACPQETPFVEAPSAGEGWTYYAGKGVIASGESLEDAEQALRDAAQGAADELEQEIRERPAGEAYEVRILWAEDSIRICRMEDGNGEYSSRSHEYAVAAYFRIDPEDLRVALADECEADSYFKLVNAASGAPPGSEIRSELQTGGHRFLCVRVFEGIRADCLDGRPEARLEANDAGRGIGDVVEGRLVVSTHHLEGNPEQEAMCTIPDPDAPPPDRDGDGHPDDMDGCPDEPGSDGGCPEPEPEETDE